MYRRREGGHTINLGRGRVADCRDIVPYNAFVLLKYNCHVNVIVVSSVGVLKYLYE
jgi:hypothetical protein